MIKAKSTGAWRVVVTRPLAQAKPLNDALMHLGVTPVPLPLLQIRSVVLSGDAIQTALSQIATAHYVIITSANVIAHCPPALIQALKNTLIITMGQTTSDSLAPFGLSVAFTPPPGTTSESLLEAPLFAVGHVRDKPIVLLTGVGGRTVLQDVLTERGARVHTVRCYEALAPTQLDVASQCAQWQQAGDPLCFVITSLHILNNLVALTPPDALAWLRTQPLIVVSDRIKDAAVRLGFEQILVSGSADVQGLLTAIKSLIG